MSRAALAPSDLSDVQLETLLDVRAVVEDVRAVEAKVDVARAALDVKVLAAMKAGVPARMLAEEMGVGIMAVYQARDRAERNRT